MCQPTSSFSRRKEACVLLACALLLIAADASESLGTESIETPRTAFRRLDHSSSTLTREATEWVSRRVGFEWPMDANEARGFELPGNYQFVWAEVSPGYRYCALTGPADPEHPDLFHATYALVDTTGAARWTLSGVLSSPPAVSDSGQVAIFSYSLRNGRCCGDTLSLALHDVTGTCRVNVHWRRFVGGRWRESCSHRPTLNDVYGFSPDGRQFVLTRWEPRDGRPEGVDLLYGIDCWDGTVWSVELGRFTIGPGDLLFTQSGDRIVVSDGGGWRGKPNHLFVVSGDGELIAKYETPDAGGAGSVLDPEGSLLYLCSQRLGPATIDLRSGELRGGVAMERLVMLRDSGDPRVSSRAALLLERFRSLPEREH